MIIKLFQNTTNLLLVLQDPMLLLIDQLMLPLRLFMMKKLVMKVFHVG
jgi:hypothetical protein